MVQSWMAGPRRCRRGRQLRRHPARGGARRLRARPLPAPLALAQACREAGVGEVRAGLRAWRRGGRRIHLDQASLRRGIARRRNPATVIRPSVVLSTRGSRGGTSLLRALAALPYVVFLPGQGGQRIQPVHARGPRRDGRALPVALGRGGRVLHAVGPDVLTLRQYLALVRGWLGLPCQKTGNSIKIDPGPFVGDHKFVSEPFQILSPLLNSKNLGYRLPFSSQASQSMKPLWKNRKTFTGAASFKVLIEAYVFEPLRHADQPDRLLTCDPFPANYT